MPATDIKLKIPLGVLNADSVAVKIWVNRLVPLKSTVPVRVFGANGGDLASAYIVDVRGVSFEELDRITRVFPGLTDVDTLQKTGELALDQGHFEEIV